MGIELDSGRLRGFGEHATRARVSVDSAIHTEISDCARPVNPSGAVKVPPVAAHAGDKMYAGRGTAIGA